MGPSQTRNENDVGDEATSGQQRPKMIYSQSYADGLSQHQHNTEVKGVSMYDVHKMFPSASVFRKLGYFWNPLPFSLIYESYLM